MIEVLRQVLLLAGLAVIQHQAEAVALVSRTLLGAIGDVLAVGRIERGRVAGGIVGGVFFCRPPADRDNPEIVIGRGGFVLIVIRGVTNLLAVRREGIVVLAAEREYRRVVVARREVARRRCRDRGARDLRLI